LAAENSAAKSLATTPATFALGNNYPNPFNAQTTINYQLPELSWARLTIYDLLGRQVRTLAEGVQAAGYHQVQWDGLDEGGVPMASGVYVYRLEAGSFRATQRMLLVK
jgi:flagellar hook assembly protein FlgD